MIDPHSSPASAVPPHRGAFTLIEVMVSIAVAIILLLGVNQVFRATAQTTGAGLALSSSQQLSRTVKATLTNDLKNGAWGTDAGILIIRNEQVYAFRNPTDQQGAADPNDPTKVNPTILAAATNANTAAANFPAGIYPAFVASSRSHRIDRIGFFVRELLDRQTSPNQLDTIPVEGNEAWVWYGHLSLPNNALLKGQTRADWVTPVQPAEYFAPGAPNDNTAINDNNFFATDFTLGRFATLLLGTDQSVLQASPDCLQISNNGSSYKPQISAPFVTPLTFDSVSANSTGDIACQSLHDVAQDSISDFTARLARFASVNNPPAAGNPWYYSMIGVELRGAVAIDHRYQASPFIPSVALDPKNPGRLGPTALALAAPIIARGCCHFIVEYAGNYLTQLEIPGGKDANGNIDGTITSPFPSSNPDHIDFVSVFDPTTNQYVRKIRWYGFPRDTNGIPGIQYDDVMPLRDVIALSGVQFNGISIQAPFEYFGQGFSVRPAAKEVPTDGTPTSKGVTEYAALGSQPDYSYTCAWGPSAAPPPTGLTSWPAYGVPKLLRITVVFDDPDGRLGSEQSYEYIIDLRN